MPAASSTVSVIDCKKVQCTRAMKPTKTIVPIGVASALWLMPSLAYAEGVGVGKLDGVFFLVGVAFFIGLIAIPAMALVSLRLNKHLNARWMTAWSLGNAILAAVLVNVFVIGFLFKSAIGFMLATLLVLSFLSVSTALLVQWRLIRVGRLDKSLKPAPRREGAA